MRKDYREPDDYEYEPTPHDEVLEKSETALHRATAARRRGKYHGPTAMSVTIQHSNQPSAPAHVDGFKTRRRAARSFDGAAASIDPRCLSA